MFTWSITLSERQIALMKHLSLRANDEHPPEFHYSHYVTSIRVLEGHGLAECRDVRQPDGKYKDVKKSGWFLTERGFHVLEMIEWDLQNFLGETAKAARKTEAAKQPEENVA